MRGALLTALVAVALLGCEDRRKEAVDKVESDSEAISKASAVVNQVIRAGPDCATAKPLIPEAYQRIEEARAKVDAPATQETLNALKVQVDRINELCP